MLQTTRDRSDLCRLVAGVLNVPSHMVSPHWVFPCKDIALAKAVTLRNAADLLLTFQATGKLDVCEVPWHRRWRGNVRGMLKALQEEGFLEPIPPVN